MTLPIQYAFEGSEVRALMINGEPWFVARDVVNAIGMTWKTGGAGSTGPLDDDEKGVNSIHTLSGIQQMQVINESGLYTLILRSREAVTPGSAAHRFRKWVTSDVLPSIRKHGAYVMPAAEAEEATDSPMAAHIEADEIVSAGRVFRALFTTARSMGMARRLAATRANQAAQRATGIDLAAELGASTWLAGPDLPAPQRRQYEMQQRLREHLAAHDWPQGFTTQQMIEALALPLGKAAQMAVGQALQLLGYTRVRLAAQHSGGPRPWIYVLKHQGLTLEAAA